MNLSDLRLREKIMTMTAEELRARMSPATLRKIRAHQGLAILLLLIMLVCVVFSVVEIVSLFRATLASWPTTPPNLATRPQLVPMLAPIGGVLLAGIGVRWCRVRATKLVEDGLERSLKEDAAEH